MQFVVQQKEHPRFKRKGADLVCAQEITLLEALAGGTFTFEHLCGKKSNIALKKGKIVKPGDVLVIENLGMPVFHSPGHFGKLYLVISVKFPKTIDEEKIANLLGVRK